MRLAEIKTYQEANEFLKSYYLPKHNLKFSVRPKDNWDYHKKITQEELIKLEWLFAKSNERILRKNWTINYMKDTYQIIKNQEISRYNLVVKESIYWNIKIFNWKKELQFTKLVSR